MANLKDHQQAMVDLLASGSGIPASASRLAHAMHDVIQELLGEVPVERLLLAKLREDSTTPGLNDKALAADVECFSSPPKLLARAAQAERRIKELENIIKQLRESNAKLRYELTEANRKFYEPEQAGCRKPGTQVWGPDCDHEYAHINMQAKTLECGRCGHTVPWPDGFNPNPSKAPV